MNKRQRKVFNLLKTRTQALGFNRKELEGLASKIDENLELEDNASDEDVDAAISSAVDAALPFLQVSQSAAQRSTQQSIQRFRDRYGITDDDDDENSDENEDDSEDNQNDTTRNRKKGNQRQRGNRNPHNDDTKDEILKLIKDQNTVIKNLTDKIASLDHSRTTDTRRKKLEKLVEGTGSFGKSTIKQFGRMTFKDDDEFQNYLDEVSEDLDAINQERANSGLSKLGTIPTCENHDDKGKKDFNVLSDEDIISIAGGNITESKKK